MITIRRRLVDRVAGTCYTIRSAPSPLVQVRSSWLHKPTVTDRLLAWIAGSWAGGTRSQCKRQAKDEEKQGSRATGNVQAWVLTGVRERLYTGIIPESYQLPFLRNQILANNLLATMSHLQEANQEQ